MAQAMRSPAADAGPVPLGWLAAVRFDGADARGFLQGQLTNDVAGLDGGGWQLSGLCNPKGRLLSSFVLGRVGEGDYVALMAHDLVEGFCLHLKKYVLRAKVRIAPQPCALGWSPSSPGVAGGSLRVGDGARSAVFEGVGGADLTAELAPGSAADAGGREGAAAWMAVQIECGMPWVCARTREEFVAQSVDFDLIGGVSFTKGCFVGQEVIARLHYRGKPKQRLFRAAGEGAAPEEGAALYCAKYGEQAAGHVVNSAAVGDAFVALACARLDAAEEEFRIGGADAPGMLRLSEIRR